MSDRARVYQSSADGARSNVLTRKPQALQVRYLDDNNNIQLVRFDGQTIDGKYILDRKLSVTTFPKSEGQVLRSHGRFKPRVELEGGK